MARGRNALGLDLGSSVVKMIQLRETKRGLTLEQFATAPLPPDTIVDGAFMNPAAVIDTVKGLIQQYKFKSKQAAISLNGHSVIIKKISLPAMSQEELQESIQWEAEQYIPFDIKDVNLDVEVLSHRGDTGHMDVLLVAAKRDMISDYADTIRRAGLEPVVVDVDAFCLHNMFERAYGFVPGEVVALLNIGASMMNINVVAGGTTAFTRDVSIGGNHFADEIQRQLNVSPEEAEAYLLGGDPAAEADAVIPQEVERVIRQVAENLASEIQRSFDFYSTTSAEGDISRVHLCGGTSKLPTVAQVLGDRLRLPVERIDPFRNILIDPKKFDLEYIKEMAPLAGTVVGLGLRRAGDK